MTRKVVAVVLSAVVVVIWLGRGGQTGGQEKGRGQGQGGCALEDPQLWSIDANGDGGLDLSDCVYVLEYLFRGGPPPRICLAQCPTGNVCDEIEGLRLRIEELESRVDGLAFSEVKMLSIPVNKVSTEHSGSSGFNDVSIAEDTGTDTAKFALVVISITSGSFDLDPGDVEVQLRKNGSGASSNLPRFRALLNSDPGRLALVSGVYVVELDATEVFEYRYVLNSGGGSVRVEIDLVGYVK